LTSPRNVARHESAAACNRTVRLLAALLLLGLIGTACGARISPQVRDAAARAILKQPAAGQSAGTGGSGEQPEGTGAAGGQNSQPQGSGTGGATAQPGSGGTASSPRAGASTPGTSGSNPKPAGHGKSPKADTCPTSGTDVGLTSTTIDLGTIADLTGPVSGLFEGAAQGVETFANYINSTGGICGHSIHFDIADSQTNCSTNQNDTQSLIGKDFALVGSFSLYDGCGATVLKKNPTVPDLHVGLDPAAIALPNHFDIAAGTRGALTGPFAYLAHKYPTQVKHVGTITEDIPSAIAAQQNFVHAAESTGWKFVYSNSASPTSSNFTSQFQTMCQRAHIQLVYIETETAQNAATMMQNESQVGCKNIINIIPIAYDQAFLPDFQGNKDSLKVEGFNAYPLFFNAGDAANIPELNLFQTWFKRSFPGKPSSLYALYGWTYGRMFQQAFENAGPVANRKTVLAALDKIRNFTANGMMPPSDPSTKTSGTHCYVMWQLSGGSFSREGDPKSGYRCDGKFLRY
jgi:hypothetical protein